jgi:hypothetical protein
LGASTVPADATVASGLVAALVVARVFWAGFRLDGWLFVALVVLLAAVLVAVLLTVAFLMFSVGRAVMTHAPR